MVTGKHSHAKYIVPIVLLCIILLLGMVAYVGRGTQLTTALTALSATESELNSTQGTLFTTQNTLLTTKAELTQTSADLTATEQKLGQTSDELTTTQKKLTTTEASYATAKTQLAMVVEDYASIQDELAALQVTFDRMAEGYGYVLKDPSYSQLKAFIAADKTDEKEYVVGFYVCHDFAADVKANAASQKNFRCAYVNIDFSGSGHAIIAFYTTDRGLVYIEPQTDEEVNLQVGWRYWTQCVIPNSGYYLPSTYDDTIESFNVIW
jgi:hypothetical protein